MEHVTLQIRNMVCQCCCRIIRQEFEACGIKVCSIRLGEAEIEYNPSVVNMNTVERVLQQNGFGLITDKEKVLVEQIKIAVIELIHYANNMNSIIRNSDYLVEKLGYSYQHLSSIFTRHENITLEKFIINHKILKAKELIEYGELTLSEIAFMMGYSSVQYLSTQFKNVTGFSVSEYKKAPGNRSGINEV